MSDVMKMWSWMMILILIIMAYFLYAYQAGKQYEGLIEDFAMCIEYHDADYETCSAIMLDAFGDVDWLDNMVQGK